MSETVLIAAATGFFGLRLVEALEAEGEEDVCTSWSPERTRGLLGNRNIRRLDMGDPESIARSMDGCEVAYYFGSLDREPC